MILSSRCVINKLRVLVVRECRLVHRLLQTFALSLHFCVCNTVHTLLKHFTLILILEQATIGQLDGFIKGMSFFSLCKFPTCQLNTLR